MDLAMEDVKVNEEPGNGFAAASFARGAEASTSGMDDEDDPIAREIDVFVKPQLDGTTQLYLLQYPLRPFWRPYNLQERCQEVRVKSQQAKVEVDLEVDVHSDNYDQSASEALRIKKQTLSSTHMDLHANYAIGLLRGNQLHLSPLHAAVQLKPSLRYLDAADEARKKEAAADAAAAEDGDRMEEDEGQPDMMPVQVQIRRRETERQEENRLSSYAYLKQKDESEEWVPLRPYLATSVEAHRVRDKMLASSDQRITFDQPPEKYIADVTPGRSLAAPASYHPEDGLETDELSRSQLEALNLSDRFKLLLTKGAIQVLQFDRLLKLAPSDSTEAEVLTVLKNHAMLVQGCWVAGSHLRYKNIPVVSGQQAVEKNALSLVRDFFLLLFTKHRFIKRDEIDSLRIPKSMVKEIMAGIATQRMSPPGWDFIEPTDRIFMKKHKEVVEDQVKRWATAEEVIRTMVAELDLPDVTVPEDNVSSPGPRALALLPAPKHEHEANYGLGANPRELDGPETKVAHKGTMSQQTRVNLIQVLRDIFGKHGVCSLEFLRSCLVEVAKGGGVPGKKLSEGEKQRVAAAGQAVAAPPQELALVVGLVARQIQGVYVLTSLGKAEVDPFRNVVIQALIARPTLRKGDVLEAAKLALKCDVPQTVYTRVLKELCMSRGGVWVLRPGDGT